VLAVTGVGHFVAANDHAILACYRALKEQHISDATKKATQFRNNLIVNYFSLAKKKKKTFSLSPPLPSPSLSLFLLVSVRTF
jgi:UDP-N-acetylglucosamine pyrophosphorylase